MTSILSQLTTLQAYCSARETLFPSEGALRWFIRTHRSGLVAAGALMKLRGRPLVHAEHFDRYVIEAAVAGVIPKVGDALEGKK